MKDFAEGMHDKVVKKYFDELQIEMSNVKDLFHEFNAWGEASMSIDELCEGVFKMKGAARSVDMVTFNNETRTYQDQLNIFMSRIEQHVQLVVEMLERQFGKLP